MPKVVMSAQSVDETLSIANALGEALQPGDTVLLIGDLGAGKTQFAKGVLHGVGSSQEAISPTFNIVLEYDDGRLPLVHMDLYRLEDAEELEDIDFYALTDEGSDHACLIEWADLFPDEMPEDALEVRIGRTDDDGSRSRTLSVTAAGEGAAQLLRRWHANAVPSSACITKEKS